MEARAFRVTGRVQGVGFRWAALETARGLGLAGWVCNESDGAVTGLVQGPEPALAEFRAWLARGPRSARVASVDWDPADPTSLRLFLVRDSSF